MLKQEAGAINVLIVIPAIDREGTTRVVMNQINGFLEQGVNAYLLVIGPFNQEAFDESGSTLPKHHMLQLKQPYTFLSTKALLSIDGLIKPVLDFISDHQIDHVIAHTPYSHFLMRLVKMLTVRKGIRFKLLQYFHSLQYKQFPLTKPSRNLFNAFNRQLAKSYDDAHISVSDAVRADVEEGLLKHNQHIVLLTPAPKTNAKETSVTLAAFASEFTILLPGRLEHNKGQLFFLSVLAKLIESERLTGKDISLLLAGDGPQRADIQSYVHANQLNEYVHLAGQLSHPVLSSTMKKADLVIVPSNYEGLPIIALESLQVGALLFTSDAGGLKEVIKDRETGFLFKAGDSADCLQKLQMLYLNRSKTLIDPEVVKNDLNERFSFENYMQKLMRIMHTL